MPLGFVWLCFVSGAHLAVGRGLFASQAGWLWSRASVVGVLCGSIFAQFLSIFGVFLSTFGLFLSTCSGLFCCFSRVFFVNLYLKGRDSP